MYIAAAAVCVSWRLWDGLFLVQVKALNRCWHYSSDLHTLAFASPSAVIWSGHHALGWSGMCFSGWHFLCDCLSFILCFYLLSVLYRNTSELQVACPFRFLHTEFRSECAKRLYIVVNVHVMTIILVACAVPRRPLPQSWNENDALGSQNYKKCKTEAGPWNYNYTRQFVLSH